MNTKTSIVALVAILVIAIGGYQFPQVKSVTDRVVGAVATLDGVDNPVIRINGLKQTWYSQPIMATSSAICATPEITATSTLRSFKVLGLTNGLGAQFFDVSTSTTAYGSSSPAYVKTYSTGATGFAMVWNGATTTNANIIGNTWNGTGQSDNIILPGQRITARIATGTPGTFSSYMTGRCSAVIEEL